MTIQYQDDIYLTGLEAARYFGVSRTTFYDRFAPNLATYKIPGYDREYYKKSDLENYQGPRRVKGDK